MSGIIAVLVYLTQSYLWPLIAGAAGAVSIAVTALLILANVREYIIIYKMEESKWNFV